MQIKVETGIPLPSMGRRSDEEYPWKTMEIGQSFLFPKDVKKSTASNKTYAAGKATGRKFALRTVAEGIRVWRKA